jgi:putative heme-binding domain-containing protein
MILVGLPTLFLALPLSVPLAQQPKKQAGMTATPAERVKIAKDFKIELLYSVPRDQEGSWVSMCVDPQGRLIVSDQDGGLYRVTPPPLGGQVSNTKVVKLAVDIGQAQGLLWAFDSLYVMVNGKNKKYPTGLYRVFPTTPGGELLDVTQKATAGAEEVRLLRALGGGGGEHGPHAILLHPDGKSLVVLHGNQTKLTKIDSSRVPLLWGEDQLLPRMPDGRGFMTTTLAPGGCFYRIDPDGKHWELLANGTRNPYDAAFNRHGELFAYDADMEWDINLPWYRPTRLCMVTSGSEWGWRNGSGKFPPYYPDNLPPVYDIGPGSPTGMVFGYGAKFPAKYQEALFMCDWSYGKLYAMHLTPEGSAYKAEAEEFLAASPLPLTDIVINPNDGAMYFAIGGRKTQSGLYRVTYVGKESTAPSKGERADGPAEQRALRHRLEAFHGRKDPKAVETVWPYLGHADRYIRFAARVALEHQDLAQWRDRALGEKHAPAALTALLALVRASAGDPFHRPKDAAPADMQLRSDIIKALERLSWEELTDADRLELLRVYGILFNRMGRPDEAESKKVALLLDAHYPSKNRFVNGELCQLLVYLQSPTAALKTMKLLEQAPTQEEQIDYAKSLRMLKTGWTPKLREQYFLWFHQATRFKGGLSIEGYMTNIRKDAIASLSEAEKVALKPILDLRPKDVAVTPVKPRPFVKNWTVAELVPKVEKGLKKRDFDRGRQLFGEAKCYLCHRFNSEGGAQGPDLTGAAGRFNVHDLLESIIEPSKVISDQYADVIITLTNGKVVTGRIINLHGDNMHVSTDMLNPSATVNVNAKQVDTVVTSKVSPMPAGLIDTLTADEILDLAAFLLSRGDRAHEMFR